MSYEFSREDQKIIAANYFDSEVQFQYDTDDSCMDYWLDYPEDILLSSEEALDALHEYVDPYNLSQFIEPDICEEANKNAHLTRIAAAMSRLEITPEEVTEALVQYKMGVK